MSDPFASRSRLLSDIVRESGFRNAWSCRIAPGCLLDVFDIELATKIPGNELSMVRVGSVTANSYGWFIADFPMSAGASEYYCCLRGKSGNASPYILLGASVAMSDNGNGNLVAEQPMPPVPIAYGLSSSGKPVPIRVDEDGYVLVAWNTLDGKR